MTNHRRMNPQKFRIEWKSNPDFKHWLEEVKGKPLKGKCSICDAEFTTDLTVIKNHSKSEKHRKNTAVLGRKQLACSIAKKPEGEEDIQKDEIRIAEYNSYE